MKHLYKTLGGALMLAICGMNATAQQLPNGGFDSTWENCVPWTSKNNTKTQGKTPQSWTISQVIGTGTLGNTTIGESTTGYNGSTYAVKLYNKSTLGNGIPAYMSLGTTWSTATGITGSNKDGGTFGGIEFTYTPDAVSFYYQRSHGTSMPNEAAAVVAYLWKGTWTQADVPGNIVLSGSATKTTMTDRERNILGMNTDQGGTVTKTDDAELIASLNCKIEEDAADWTRFLQPLEYVSTSTPAKFNIIIASNDYFGGQETIGANNTLIVDNVELVYYSRLSALSVNGVAVDGFADDVYNYTMSGTTLPTEAEIEATVMGRSAVKSVAIDNKEATVTITVTNVDADIDGQSSHSYMLQYEKAPAKQGEATDYPGYLNISMQDGEDVLIIAEDDPATITITDYNDGTCDFVLPNLSLASLGMNLGDIKVEGATVVKNDDGSANYTGTAEKMPLLEGALMADVNLNGTISDAGIVNMTIDVIWIQDESDRTADVPITVTFTTNKVSGINSISTVSCNGNAPVDVYTITGVKVMSNVNAAEAVKSLDKGFYIMGNKKVVIR